MTPAGRQGLMAGAIVLFVMGFIWSSWRRGLLPPERFVVARGASAHQIAQQLRRQGLILHPWTFLIWVKLDGKTAIRPGVYSISRSLGGLQILRVLRAGPPLVRVTFPEGWTSKQMAALLESKGVTSGADFLAIVNKDKREGFLFPDTYFFEQSLAPSQVIDRMIQRFHEKEPKDILTQAKVMHLSYLQMVTMASIVEREARVPQERPIIAGVFYNRLRKHWRLESCATVEYALGGWKSQLTYKDLDVNSPYNTYRHMGLPPGPICNPGAAAMEAAVHPASTDMMFFVAEGDGTHRFSKYYSEHLAAQGVKPKHPANIN